MPLRDILVHLNSSPRTAERLKLAISLARRDDARLVGVFAQCADAYQVGVVAVWPPESYTKAAAESREQFEGAVPGLKDAQWIDVNRGSDHEIVHHMTEAARHYDLTILGQKKRKTAKIAPRELVEQLIVDGPSPFWSYLTPVISPISAIARSSPGPKPRAAARALNDALVLFKPGANVSVVSMGLGTERQKLSADRIGDHLRAHQIEAHIEHLMGPRSASWTPCSTSPPTRLPISSPWARSAAMDIRS